jgi:hypothetical protein
MESSWISVEITQSICRDEMKYVVGAGVPSATLMRRAYQRF